MNLAQQLPVLPEEKVLQLHLQRKEQPDLEVAHLLDQQGRVKVLDLVMLLIPSEKAVPEAAQTLGSLALLDQGLLLNQTDLVKWALPV